jgi:ribosomal protein S18 acetylase RimI-like enzyme
MFFPITIQDENELSEICFRTSFIYPDLSQKDLVNWRWLIPFCRIETENCFKAVIDDNKIAGYILSTLDTLSFEKKCAAEFNKKISDLKAHFLKNHKLTEEELEEFNEHFNFPVSKKSDPDYQIKEEYPAHLHINILPAYQGQRLGPKLIDYLIQQLKLNKCPGLHLGVGAENTRAMKFYERYGFDRINVNIEGAVFYGLKL